MKFTYIKLSKNQEMANDEKIQNEVNSEKIQPKVDVEKFFGRGKYSKGKRYLDRNVKSDKQKILNVNSEERFLNKSYKNVEDNYKNEERKERAKKILSKNQVALYTISLMLIASGYFNYTNNLKMAELGDAQLVSTNLSVNENEVIDEVNGTKTASIENKIEEIANDENQVNKTNGEISGENEVNAEIVPENETKTVKNEGNDVETSANIENKVETSANSSTESEYFAQTKLERDKMYSQMIETYEKILENNNISTEQKNTASEEIKNINNKRNGIATSETLIKAKGIEEVVIIVNSEVIDAIIKSEDNLSTEQVAQVSNIISRELDANIENIHITTHK